MRKIINSCLVIGIAIAYLLTLGRVSLSENEALFLIRLAGEIIRMVLSVVTFFIIYSKLNKELMNPLKKEGYYIAFMPLIFGVVILIGINYYILDPHKIDHISFDFYKQALEWLQVTILVVIMKWYTQDKDTKKAIYLILGAMISVILLTIYDIDVIDHSYWGTEARCLMRVLTIMMILGVGYSYYKKKDLASLFMRRIFLASLFFKAMINAGGIIRILTDNIVFALMQCILQIVFMMWLISCINEYTYRCSWAEMEFDIEDRKKERTKMQYNELLLTAAVENIQRRIEGMVTRLEKLQLHLELQEDQIKYMDKIKNNCLKLYGLSCHILKSDNQVTHIEEKLIFENINLYEYVQNLIEAMEPYIREKGIQLEFCANQHKLMVRVHKESIERILFNLISNAVKYNKKEGSIKVILSQRKEWVYLCVQDSGIGISESDLPTIFDKYGRVKNKLTQKQEGSGLGLNNVKGLVEKHNGKIKIISREGKGTIVCIKLPTVYIPNVEDKEKLTQILVE